MNMKNIVAGTALTLSGITDGQNLVPNPSFEEYTLCPTNISQIDRADGWTSLSGSSDYFNACCANDSMGVPYNTCGYQHAADGQAYAGVCMYLAGIPYYRENIWAQLQVPMNVGTLYHMSMKVSPGGYGNSHDNSAHWASNGIGMRLFTGQLAPGVVQDNMALLYMDQVLNDTAGWTTISRTFIADSAYRFVLIGNFFSDSLLQLTPLDPDGTFGAYAFIDQVCISAEPGVCEEPSYLHEWQATRPVLNTTFYNELYVDLENWTGTITIDLTNIAGQRCKSLATVQHAVTLETSDLGTGVYLLTVANSQGQKESMRLIHLVP